MEAKTIRFEHPYVKLGCEPLFMFGPDVFCDGDRAQLIAVQKCNVKDLSEGLVEYDTYALWIDLDELVMKFLNLEMACTPLSTFQFQ